MFLASAIRLLNLEKLQAWLLQQLAQPQLLMLES
jgi:hypothetical protein